MIKNYTVAFLLLFIFIEEAVSQSIVFEKYYTKGDFPNCLVQTPTGGYMIAGEREIPASPKDELYLSKFDSKGNLLWVKTYYDSIHNIIPRDIKVSFDSTYFLLATIASSSYTDSKVMLMHVDSNGSILWIKTYYNNSGMDATRMDLSKVGGIYIACNSGTDFTNYATLTTDVLKVDMNGNVLWNNIYNFSGWGNFISDIKTLNNGGFMASCGIYGNSVWLMKGDMQGNLQWLKGFHSGDWALPLCICIPDNNTIIGGGEINFPSDLSWLSYEYPLIFKADSDGNFSFVKFIKSDWKGSWVRRILKAPDNQFVLAIEAQSLPGINSQAMIIKMDESGIIQSSKIYEKDLHLYYFNDLIPVSDGGFAGISAISFSTYNNYAFFKTDQDGNTSCDDALVDLTFTDTSFYTLNQPSIIVTPGITVDSIELPEKIIIAESNVICEDDSFPPQVTSAPSIFSSDKVEIKISPNPLHDISLISLSVPTTRFFVFELYDLYGQKLREELINASDAYPFNRNGLINGIYFYRITESNRTIGEGKLIVQ